MRVPDRHRITSGMVGSDPSYGNNGVFQIPHYRIRGYLIFCIASDGEGWQHVSVTVCPEGKKKANRCPTWEEMCWVKDQFWNKDETVIQYHPPESEYVNNHPFCLHLWKPDNIEIPLPPSIMVGYKNVTA